MGNITKYLKGIFLISAVLLFVVGCSSVEKKEENNEKSKEKDLGLLHKQSAKL